MDAYQLYNYYEISSDPNGNTTGKLLRLIMIQQCKVS